MLLVTASSVGASGPSRLGIVATKKVGNSVQRSRIKRLCRECFRLWPEFVPDGIDLVVIARDGAAELDLARVRAEWEGARRALLERCRVVLVRGDKRSKEPTEPAEATKKAARPNVREGSREATARPRPKKAR